MVAAGVLLEAPVLQPAQRVTLSFVVFVLQRTNACIVRQVIRAPLRMHVLPDVAVAAQAVVAERGLAVTMSAVANAHLGTPVPCDHTMAQTTQHATLCIGAA